MDELLNALNNLVDLKVALALRKEREPSFAITMSHDELVKRIEAENKRLAWKLESFMDTVVRNYIQGYMSSIASDVERSLREQARWK